MMENDCGGTDWIEAYKRMAQEAMKNNPCTIVTDAAGKIVKPERDYWPHIKNWYKRRCSS